MTNQSKFAQWTADNVGDPAPSVARVQVALTSEGTWDQSIIEYHDVEFGHYPYLHIEPKKKDKYPLSLSFIERNKADVYGPKWINYTVMPGCDAYAQKWCVFDKQSDIDKVVDCCKKEIIKAFDTLKERIEAHIQMVDQVNSK